MAKTILVFDNQKGFKELIKDNLLSEGYKVLVASDGREGISKLENLDNSVDLIFIAHNLNQIGDGYLSQKIQDFVENRPVIILIIREEQLEENIDLEQMEIDDYIVKPFSFKNLLTKINSYLDVKKHNDILETARGKIIQKGAIVINTKTYEVKINNENIDLTPKEFSLLKYLLINENNILSRNKLLKKIWGYQYSGQSRTVDVHIRRLRKKIGKEYIKTVRGIGYKFVISK